MVSQVDLRARYLVFALKDVAYLSCQLLAPGDSAASISLRLRGCRFYIMPFYIHKRIRGEYIFIDHACAVCIYFFFRKLIFVFLFNLYLYFDKILELNY